MDRHIGIVGLMKQPQRATDSRYQKNFDIRSVKDREPNRTQALDNRSLPRPSGFQLLLGDMDKAIAFQLTKRSSMRNGWLVAPFGRSGQVLHILQKILELRNRDNHCSFFVRWPLLDIVVSDHLN